MFKRLFGGGNNNFYLELKEDKSQTVSQSTSIIDNNIPESLETGHEEESVKVEQSLLEISKPALKAKADSGTIRKKNFRKQKVIIEGTPVNNSASTSGLSPTPVIAIKSTSENTGPKTFAPKYLIPNCTNARRRPGPNMNAFLEMASQVRITPSKTIQAKTISSTPQTGLSSK